jgi:hypothetical protein
LSAPDPPEAELRALHWELVAEHPTAAARMAELVLPALRRRFAARRGDDPHVVESTIGLSIARYVADPGRYDPDAGPLLAWLWRDVDGDLRNELASRRRRRNHETPSAETVELAARDRNPSPEEEVLDAVDRFDRPPSMVTEAMKEAAGLSRTDRAILELQAAGVRSTAAYADLLGIGHLPVADQRAEVKRHKDRLRKRLETIRGRVERPH